ncbi:MAG: hypothetical protein HYV09_18120 [Deltaproteobacteria bacterium]|nr:hypothetical protein [Deltaproteobacteria bacterium]
MRFDLTFIKPNLVDDPNPIDHVRPGNGRTFGIPAFFGSGAQQPTGSLTGYFEVLDASDAIVAGYSLTGTLWIFDGKRGAWVQHGPAAAALPTRALCEWRWSGWNETLTAFLQLTSIAGGTGGVAVRFFGAASGIR